MNRIRSFQLLKGILLAFCILNTGCDPYWLNNGLDEAWHFDKTLCTSPLNEEESNALKEPLYYVTERGYVSQAWVYLKNYDRKDKYFNYQIRQYGADWGDADDQDSYTFRVRICHAGGKILIEARHSGNYSIQVGYYPVGLLEIEKEFIKYEPIEEINGNKILSHPGIKNAKEEGFERYIYSTSNMEWLWDDGFMTLGSECLFLRKP